MTRVVGPSTRLKRTSDASDLIPGLGTTVSEVVLGPSSTENVTVPMGAKKVSIKNEGAGAVEFNFNSDTSSWRLALGEEFLKIELAESVIINISSVAGPATVKLLFEG